MRFELLDKVLSVDAERIVAVKRVSLAEEYLADHFPTFPVLPGVMMLEAATQACGWLLRLRTAFALPVVALKEARNVKYGHFVPPGSGLRVEAERVSGDEASGQFKVLGVVELGDGIGEKTAFTARLEVVCFRPGEKCATLSHLDGPLTAHVRRRWEMIAPCEVKVTV